jgi:hypothetical protein
MTPFWKYIHLWMRFGVNGIWSRRTSGALLACLCVSPSDITRLLQCPHIYFKVTNRNYCFFHFCTTCYKPVYWKSCKQFSFPAISKYVSITKARYKKSMKICVIRLLLLFLKHKGRSGCRFGFGYRDLWKTAGLHRTKQEQDWSCETFLSSSMRC